MGRGRPLGGHILMSPGGTPFRAPPGQQPPISNDALPFGSPVWPPSMVLGAEFSVFWGPYYTQTTAALQLCAPLMFLHFSWP